MAGLPRISASRGPLQAGRPPEGGTRLSGSTDPPSEEEGFRLAKTLLAHVPGRSLFAQIPGADWLNLEWESESLSTVLADQWLFPIEARTHSTLRQYIKLSKSSRVHPTGQNQEPSFSGLNRHGKLSTRGWSDWVRSSQVRLLDSSVPHNSLPERVGPLGLGVVCAAVSLRSPESRPCRQSSSSPFCAARA